MLALRVTADMRARGMRVALAGIARFLLAALLYNVRPLSGVEPAAALAS
jgi:hypothetical protein